MIDIAEQCSREALEIDEKEREESNPKIPHRLMNLSIVLIMKEKLEEASSNLCRASQLLVDKHDVTRIRVMFLQYVLLCLLKQDSDEFLQNLKVFLRGSPLNVYSDIVIKWDVQYFLVYLYQKLSIDTCKLLEALIKVINDPAKIEILDNFPQKSQT
ncbi:MAG: hypothetical protein IPH20_18015 [Bacteroidales bacterium]|nr:hypothetical protein [Bacteroidales bacterium]